MIVVSYEKSRESCTLRVEGHAGYAARGSDIVCAAASILFYTLANYLSARKEAEVQVTKRNGDALLTARGEEAGKGLALILTGFFLLQESYPEYVRVQESPITPWG